MRYRVVFGIVCVFLRLLRADELGTFWSELGRHLDYRKDGVVGRAKEGN